MKCILICRHNFNGIEALWSLSRILSHTVLKQERRASTDVTNDRFHKNGWNFTVMIQSPADRLPAQHCGPQACVCLLIWKTCSLIFLPFPYFFPLAAGFGQFRNAMGLSSPQPLTHTPMGLPQPGAEAERRGLGTLDSGNFSRGCE